MSFLELLPPELQKKCESLNISAKDIVEQFVRGSGKGGQKINKTASTVYLKHLPTGLEVKCQKHRERNSNRVSAYKLLIKKIELQKLGKKSEIAKKIHKLIKQKKRRSKKAKEKILVEKNFRSEIKQARKKII